MMWGAGQVAEGWTRVHLDGNPNWMSTQVFAQGGWVEKIGGENSQILSVENLAVGDPFETLPLSAGGRFANWAGLFF